MRGTDHGPAHRALVLLAWASVCSSGVLAQAIGEHPDTAPAITGSLSPIGFEENKGQVKTMDGEPAPFVRFRLSRNNTNIFLLPRGIAYQFDRTHQPDGLAELRGKHWRNTEEEARLDRMEREVRLETYRMDMELEGADRNARISTEARSADHTNYYNHDAFDVHTYGRVTYHDVYPHIDWCITATGTGIEHDFIVRPGGDPSRIRMRYAHHEELRLNDAGELIHGNRLGRFTEAMPVSYQEGKMIPTSFVLQDDELSFAVGAYDKDRELRIDPPRQWGTYYGGTASDWSISVDVDAAGNVYLAGWTSSTGGIATFGAQQHTFAGLDDGMLVKFNGDGVRQWGTYYGGSQDDAFAYCAVSGSSVYACGISQSPGLATVHQIGWAGNWDGLLVKFNTESGLRDWSTYYGGAAEDRGRGCAVDGIGNVFMSGFTYSDDAGAISSGGHQNARNGDKDGFLVKFNSDGTRIWGTYYGGSNVDEAFGCAADSEGNAYLSGGTGSVPDESIATGNGHQPIFGGAADAYLAKFSPEGTRLWGTYYGGPQSDYGFSCTVDASDNPYLTGDTFSGSGTAIATGGAHQTALGGGCDAFLVKFNSSGWRIWGTYYGGVNSESGRGCSANAADHIYLAGATESQYGIAENGHQMAYGGGEVDGYLAAFDSNGDRMFGTYYGGTLRDEAYSCAADGLNKVYLVGRTLSTNGISTSGAHQSAINGPDDAFLVRFGEDEDCLGVAGGTDLPGTACDDNDPCSTDDVYSLDCICIGTPNGLDTDGDGIPDCQDGCPGIPGNVGDPCDDANPETVNDVITVACQCVGAPANCTVATDCNDQDDCTFDECVNLACVYTTIDLDPIAGPADVDAPGFSMFSIPLEPGIDLFSWSLPIGWTSSDTNSEILEVEIGFVPSGEITLCVTGIANTCEVDTCKDIMVHAMIGLEEHSSSSSSILVRPNPSADEFLVTVPQETPARLMFTVTDIAGRQVDARITKQGQDTWSILMGHARPGAYQLLIDGNGRNWSSRLLVSP